eukprot:TRINITY_DN6270_c0_g1_i2.p1 TRINITY_DN6270_c0_g1~~TRINITY_DN6270_c0_g1_i2.p1  ORF type:complete len:1129 (-),score=142.73 TRINITY_DN6270_c0_g1_i2:68-3259(-)
MAEDIRDGSGAGDIPSLSRGSTSVAGQSLCCYVVSVTLAVGGLTALNIVMWSGLGIGREMLAFLIDECSYYYRLPFVGCVVLLCILYFLDFFWPPHLSGQFFRLSRNDRIGRGVFAGAGVMFVLYCLMMAKWYPFVPTLFTLTLQPASAAVVRYLTFTSSRPWHLHSPTAFGRQETHTKLAALQEFVGEEQDTMGFLKASLIGFWLSATGAVGAWIYWAVVLGKGLERIEDPGVNKDFEYMVWSTPLCVGVANVVFGLFVLFRIVMEPIYSDTVDIDAVQQSGSYQNKLWEELNGAADETTLKTSSSSHGRFLSHAEHIKKLSMIIKVVGVIMMVFVGLCYVASQFIFASGSELAGLLMGLLGFLSLSFVTFVYVCFRRVAAAMGYWFTELPLFKAARALKSNDWVRAFLLCVGLPMIPVILVASCVNQWVRRRRKMYADPSNLQAMEATAKELSDPLHVQWVTPRVAVHLKHIWLWKPPVILHRCFMWCMLFYVIYVLPLFFNVFCSWVGGILKHVHFSIILVLMFLIGVFLFLLPPVPGATIYLFGGAILADQCPEALGGFWGGAIINIILSLVLKLTACAIQQKCIGEVLGSQLWIRQLVGIHTVQIRCIEKILQERGLSAGKVAILCGGPDWPVSVLAGILKLSVVQCLIGTAPVLLWIAPFALTGSCYIKMGSAVEIDLETATEAELAAMRDQQMWNNTAKLMMLVAAALSMVFYAIIGWAIQNTLEKHYNELSRALRHNVELHWLDYKVEQVKLRSSLEWSQVPSLLRWLYVTGAFVQIMGCHAIFFMYSILFGAFKVSDDINTLVFLKEPPTGLVSPKAILIFISYGFTWLFWGAFRAWWSAKTRPAKVRALQELSLEEAGWKATWLSQVDAAEQAQTRISAKISTSDEQPARAPLCDDITVMSLDSVVAAPVEDAPDGRNVTEIYEASSLTDDTQLSVIEATSARPEEAERSESQKGVADVGAPIESLPGSVSRGMAPADNNNNKIVQFAGHEETPKAALPPLALGAKVLPTSPSEERPVTNRTEEVVVVPPENTTKPSKEVGIFSGCCESRTQL